jgi:hypothetical protein
VKHDGEGFHYHHAHAAMVIIFEAKGCVTWCPKRFQDEDHTYISGSMDERIMMSLRCLHEPWCLWLKVVSKFVWTRKRTSQPC